MKTYELFEIKSFEQDIFALIYLVASTNTTERRWRDRLCFFHRTERSWKRWVLRTALQSICLGRWWQNIFHTLLGSQWGMRAVSWRAHQVVKVVTTNPWSTQRFISELFTREWSDNWSHSSLYVFARCNSSSDRAIRRHQHVLVAFWIGLHRCVARWVGSILRLQLLIVVFEHAQITIHVGLWWKVGRHLRISICVYI